MPAGYGAQCKVCNSPHRADVERWAKEDGMGLREIAKRLADLGLSVSHIAVRRHLIEHFDVKAEAKEQYEKSKVTMQTQVEKRLSDLEMLDEVIQANHEIHLQTTGWMKRITSADHESPRPPAPPLALVQLHKESAAEMRQAIKQKLELLGDDPESKKADAVSSLVDMVMAAGEDDG